MNALSEPQSCFHCGNALPPQLSWPVEIDGAREETCCPGCQAVVQSIAAAGCSAYYGRRSAYAQTPQTVPANATTLEIYDHPAVQRTFVYPAGASGRHSEAAILLDGLTCGACVWLIERRLAELEGVKGVTINYATRRARIRWDETRVKLSTILRALADLGFSAQPYDPRRAERALAGAQRALLWRLALAAAAMMQVMMYAVPAYVAPGAMSADHAQLMRIASLVLTAPVVLWSALPFYAGALRELRTRNLGMDTPVSLAIIVGFAASGWSTLSATGEVYFDTIAMFVFLLLGGRYLEMKARGRAAAAQERLASVMPQSAERLDRFPEPRRRADVPALTLVPGDHVAVRPGAPIPADGVIVEGSSAADESLVTGESRPVPKAPGSAVKGGTVNLYQPIVLRVTAAGEHTTLAGVMRLMDRAQAEKPSIAIAADRAARVFVTAILAIAIGAAAVWYVIDPPRAVWVAVAVLMVTCPCALSLATPTALTAATDALYRAGVLVTRAHALETLAKATHFVFDKTGTLTSGSIRLNGVISLGREPHAACLDLAAVLEAGSEHPIARAFVAEARPACSQATQVTHVPGRGVEGTLGERRMRIGTPDFVAALHGKALPPELAFTTEEVTVIALGDCDGWVALFTFAETLRPHARAIVSALRASGRTVCVLSGDRAARAEHVARCVGADLARGDAQPHEKVEYVRALQRDGATVAMIGDGVNDAPVLAQAQVSMAMGSGTELARVSADVVLTGADLRPLAGAVKAAADTMRVIRQNIGWAMLYNVIAVPLAAAGQLSPLGAAVGMSLSSLAVVLNALRLARAAQAPPSSARASPADHDTLGASRGWHAPARSSA